MFNPSKTEVRQFFIHAWRKHTARQILSPLEDMAARWMIEHPQYHGDLTNEAAAIAADYSPTDGRTNPFLHLSMHLSLSEQVQADQPAGIRQAYAALCERLTDPHAAQHQMMECLGEMLWTAQRNQAAPDGQQYLRCLRQRAGLPVLD